MISKPRVGAQSRRDAQAVEITLALLIGCTVLIVLVLSGLLAARLLGWSGSRWDGLAQFGLLVAAMCALTSTMGVLIRSRRRGI